jgi:hypoxanthine phosphoribosyltransferase
MTLEIVQKPVQDKRVTITRLKGFNWQGPLKRRHKWTPTRPPVHFVHPSEAEFARVLDFYQVEWQYEPRSFPLERHPDGSIARMFTPDFYLPDLDLYVELTTQKQNLVSRKNRKLRLLKELYPDINIRLFYRKDLQRFLVRFGVRVTSMLEPE